MDALQTRIRPYAWGSRTALALLQGRPAPTDGPEAELWVGAHPGAPSRLVRDGRTVDLHDVLAADPERELGPAVVAEFGPRLPYLLKVLAVEAPLSLQAHPDATQARAGFAAEEAAGIPLDSPARNYRDASPKPELVCAVTPFEALCGFRPLPGTVRLMDRLTGRRSGAVLAPYAEALRRGGESALREVVTSLLRLDGDAARGLVAAVGDTCAKEAGAALGAFSSGSDVGWWDAAGDDPDTVVYACVADLAERHPGDTGVVVALLLNHVRLLPGEAIFVPAGGLHAYLRGVGVEVMGNSDNVLRGGLTPKHVDADALLSVLRFTAAAVPPVEPVGDGTGTVRWPTPTREFSLARTTVDGDAVLLPAGVPQIVLCVEGEVRAVSGGTTVDLRGGAAAFVAASDGSDSADGAVTLTGRGVVFRASPGSVPVEP
ncbi:MAG TPA: mannose-6-phosphate isomerase, class I [Mycobacteriales bacterium]